jgi:hypothetical protein
LRAYACANDILKQVSAWSDERVSRGDEPIHIGIGLA